MKRSPRELATVKLTDIRRPLFGRAPWLGVTAERWKRHFPDLHDVSGGTKTVLGIATASILCAVVLLTAPAESMHGGVAALAGGNAFVGTLVGCLLLVSGTRTYLLGFPGLVVCGYLGLFLAVFAGLVLYLGGAGALNPLTQTTSANAQHIVTSLALIGLLASLLLVISPYAPGRRVVQPCLLAVAMAGPAAGFLVLLTGVPEAERSASVSGIAGLVALVAGFLAAPVQFASALEWTDANVKAARGAATRVLQEGRRLAVLLVAEGSLMAALVSGAVPIRGAQRASAIVASASISQWAQATMIVVLGLWFLFTYDAALDTEEGKSAAWMPGLLISQIGLAGALLVFLEGISVLLHASLPEASTQVVIVVAGFGAGVLLVAGGQSLGRGRVVAGLVALTAIAVAGVTWPTPHELYDIDLLRERMRLPLTVPAVNSAGYLAASAALCTVVGAVVWAVYRVFLNLLLFPGVSGVVVGRGRRG